MAVRQYIGARYVPKFSDVNGGVWDNTYSYEALEIVKNGNDYYTAKKPVPVGVAITNTEYWALTGNYNGAISTLQEEIDDINEVITDNNKNSILVFGDSWASLDNAEDYPNRIRWITTRMGTDDRIFNYAVGGSTTVSLATQFTAAAADDDFSNESVRSVIIIVGINDYMTDNPAATFISKVNELYTNYRDVFPKANWSLLFDCMSPNSLTGTHNETGCYNYFKSIYESLNIPAFYLGLYLLQTSDFESSSGSSYHLTIQGGQILGNIFDQLINGKIPTIRRLISKFAADTFYNGAVVFKNNVGTDKNVSACGILIHTTGNDCRVTLELSISSVQDGDAIAFKTNLAAPAVYNKFGFIPSPKFKPVSGTAFNQSSYRNTNAISRDALFTGTYGDTSLTDAHMIYFTTEIYTLVHIIEFTNI